MATLEETMSLRIPKPLKAQLKESAESNGQSMNSYVIYALKTYLDFMESKAKTKK